MRDSKHKRVVKTHTQNNLPFGMLEMIPVKFPQSIIRH